MTTFSAPAMSVRHANADRKALPRHAREHNRSLIVRTLYQAGPQSRADLARATGLAKVTVSDLVMELLQAGVLRELGTRSAKGPGKPAVILDLAWDAFLVAAVDMSDYDVIRAALLTMDAQIVEEMEVPRRGATGREAVDILLTAIGDLLGRADRPVLGIGVGAPGIIGATGEVLFAPNLNLTGVPLRAVIEEEFDIPSVVMNDANLAAVGEQLYGQAPDDFLLIKVGEGIGGGLILGGNLISGSRHTVGEIGHLVGEMDAVPGEPYNPDHILERWMAVPHLRARLDAVSDDHRDDVLRQAGRRLGAALAPLIATLDLTDIVLSGPEDLLAGPLPDEAMEVVRRRTLPQTHQDLHIRLSAEGDQLVLLGCAAQVLSSFLGVARGALVTK